jgi:hypothetical protein
LEHRDQPNDGITDTPLPPVPVVEEAPANQAPEIVDFNCEEVENGLFLITGRVVDEDPDGLVVTLGGGTSAAGTTIVCNSDGTFSILVTLRTDGTDTGYITATTTDDQNLDSEEVEFFVNPTPP